jgi:hypothetical protein
MQGRGSRFLFKQWGGTRKALNGRKLNGRTYDEYPPRYSVPVPDRAECLALARSCMSFDWNTGFVNFPDFAPA